MSGSSAEQVVRLSARLLVCPSAGSGCGFSVRLLPVAFVRWFFLFVSSFFFVLVASRLRPCEERDCTRITHTYDAATLGQKLASCDIDAYSRKRIFQRTSQLRIGLCRPGAPSGLCRPGAPASDRFVSTGGSSILPRISKILKLFSPE